MDEEAGEGGGKEGDEREGREGVSGVSGGKRDGGEEQGGSDVCSAAPACTRTRTQLQCSMVGFEHAPNYSNSFLHPDWLQ